MEMTFVAVTEENKYEFEKVMKAKEGTVGNNILIITPIGSDNLYQKTRSHAGLMGSNAYMSSYVDSRGYEQLKRREGSTGNMAYLAEGESGNTMIHETLHNWGLGDHYLEKYLTATYEVQEFKNEKLIKTRFEVIHGGNQEGYDGDIMSGSTATLSASKLGFAQVHLDKLISRGLELKKDKGNSFIMSDVVDSASSRDISGFPHKYEKSGTFNDSNTYKEGTWKNVYIKKD